MLSSSNLLVIFLFVSTISCKPRNSADSSLKEFTREQISCDDIAKNPDVVGKFDGMISDLKKAGIFAEKFPNDSSCKDTLYAVLQLAGGQLQNAKMAYDYYRCLVSEKGITDADVNIANLCTFAAQDFYVKQDLLLNCDSFKNSMLELTSCTTRTRDITPKENPECLAGCQKRTLATLFFTQFLGTEPGTVKRPNPPQVAADQNATSDPKGACGLYTTGSPARLVNCKADTSKDMCELKNEIKVFDEVLRTPAKKMQFFPGESSCPETI